jgi:hypothetical protein
MTRFRAPGVDVIAGHGRNAMPPSVASLTTCRSAPDAGNRRTGMGVALVAAPHLAALALMVWGEAGFVAKLAFLFTWGLLNFFWLALLRRPAVSAALSLALIAAVVFLSRLKSEIVWMTANFLDVWIVNRDTVSFLLSVRPDIFRNALIAAALLLPVLWMLWRADRARVRLRAAALGFALCLAGLAGVSLAFPQEDWEAFVGESYVSKFSRSGVTAISELLVHGYIEADAAATERLAALSDFDCTPGEKPPHIVMVHDESSFDVRAIPGVKVPPGYGAHFESFDGRARRFIAEGAGGPSWYTEYNVLSGLAARSFGRFAYYVTHIAAGHVERGLPRALRRCGYRTFTIYPAMGAFLSAKAFQASAGVQTFLDQGALGTDRIEPDRFYYEAARRMIERERGKGPVFLFTYLAQNHFPWDYRWRPDLMPQWRDLGNPPVIDEYLRRQALSVRDYAEFVAALRRDFPGESFLLVRYGDHQPEFAAAMLEPGIGEAALSRRLMAHDPRYFTTYYAIDTVNFTPADIGSALATVEGAYLPLIVQEAAGLPLDPSFAEQKRIMQRCRGEFYACKGGAEARRFNRLLIDAGLIKGL